MKPGSLLSCACRRALEKSAWSCIPIRLSLLVNRSMTAMTQAEKTHPSTQAVAAITKLKDGEIE